MSANGNPYTVPYTGSRSRGEAEGFAPASQPAPARNMNGTVATPYQAATVATAPQQPSNSGAGPSRMQAQSNPAHEPADKAYLGPAMYSDQQQTTQRQHAQEPGPAHGYHTVTVEDEDEVQDDTRANGGDSPKDTGSSPENADTLHKSTDGANDEADVGHVTTKGSQETGYLTVGLDTSEPESMTPANDLERKIQLLERQLSITNRNMVTFQNNVKTMLKRCWGHIRRVPLAVNEQREDLNSLQVQAINQGAFAQDLQVRFALLQQQLAGNQHWASTAWAQLSSCDDMQHVQADIQFMQTLNLSHRVAALEQAMQKKDETKPTEKTADEAMEK